MFLFTLAKQAWANTDYEHYKYIYIYISFENQHKILATQHKH